MITVCIDTINGQGQPQQFSVHRVLLEKVLDFLNTLVSSGCTLISVYSLSKSGKPVALPTEVFGEELMNEGLERLEQEWQAILN